MTSGVYERKSLEARFTERVLFEQGTDCHTWTGAVDRKGYGRMWARGKDTKATWVAWFLKHRVWPTKQMLHICDNPTCVNPEHLFEGDIVDNMRDKVAKNRHAKGEQNGNSKLTAQDVVQIRKATGENKELAVKYGVHPSLIWMIRTNRIWKHLTHA